MDEVRQVVEEELGLDEDVPGIKVTISGSGTAEELEETRLRLREWLLAVRDDHRARERGGS